jgi:battenin
VAWQATNLTLVYFFEYVASVGAADRSQPCMPTTDPSAPCQLPHSSDWFVANAFVLLAFCYQLGVFISRSSLRFVRIRHVEWLTLIQAGNFVLWICQAYFKFMPIGAQLPMMVFVGLLGGASYVNIFYNLLNDDEYPEEDRELIINMAALMINFGIIMASVFTLVMDATFLFNK